jgi:hypothetical protein
VKRPAGFAAEASIPALGLRRSRENQKTTVMKTIIGSEMTTRWSIRGGILDECENGLFSIRLASLTKRKTPPYPDEAHHLPHLPFVYDGFS